MLCVAACVSAWGYSIDTTKKWHSDRTDQENVAKISGLGAAGQLTQALADLANTGYEYKVLYISGTGNWTFDDNDLAALATINCPTLDLQGMFTGAGGAATAPFTFSNPNIKRVILPDCWGKEAVKAAAEALINGNSAVGGNAGFESALSQDGPQNNYDNAKKDAGLVAYVNMPNTLQTAVSHIVFNGISNGKKLGDTSDGYFALSLLKYVAIMGHVSARDFSADGTFDENGHFVFNVAADETTSTKNMGVGGVLRAPQGTTQIGALTNSGTLIKLDLEDAIIEEIYNEDLCLGFTGVLGAQTKEVKLPKYAGLKTIPADCLCGDYNSLEEICIPGNIEYIKTRAFYNSVQCLRHIWTTGTKTLAEGEVDHTIYDNGAYLMSNQSTADHYGHAPLDDGTWNCQGSTPRYGTITLPPNLKLIESNVFSSKYVKDVYVLSTTAPECHVDAFPVSMYSAHGTIQGVVNGMVTRESYCNNKDDGSFVTMLHYPRETTDPNIQRYTDPTREYTVATTLRDGKGNIIYFPNLSELNRAFQQGTTGYLWYAWNMDRHPDNWGDPNAFKNVLTFDSGHLTDNQKAANEMWEKNPDNDTKSDRSFYDVRLDGDGQPTLAQPTGLDWYYNTVWRGYKLYPQMETTETSTVIGQIQETDSEGRLLYEVGDCDWVQDYSYVQDDNGSLYWDRVITENENGNFVKDYSYEVATNGEYYHPFKDRNYDSSKPKPWYSKSQKQVADKNGDYIWTNTIGNQYNYTDVSTWLSWSHSEEELATMRDGGWTFRMEDVWTEDENGTHYVSTGYAKYADDVTDFVKGINDTRYNKIYSEEYRAYNSETDVGEQRYDVTDNGLRNYNSATDADNSKRYNKVYKDYTYRQFDSTKDDVSETRYCPKMVNVYRQEKGTQYDYRGWHQFVLTAYATNSDEEFTPVKFYQTDNDWWTVCLPYDLKYSEMKKFFGNETTGAIPYLSKLRYVVRDYTDKKITLMFSKNLMVYKEAIDGDNVHGTIDDATKWSDSEISVDPVILHAGVPYLIRPNIDVNAGRSFDVFKDKNEDLYTRLTEAEKKEAVELANYIYNGEYTVPAYVIGDGENTIDSKTIANKDGYSATYTSGNITYQGKPVAAKVSDEFTYTFVGSFFNSMMPQYCYFLGWDSKKEKAAFWYNKVVPEGYTWTNQTGVICANFDTNTEIHAATGVKDPARWKIDKVTSDDLIGVTGAKSYVMDFGGDMSGVVDGISLREDAESLTQPTVAGIYDLQGVKRAQSLENLPKGVYIVNGKKYVVK